MRCLLAFSDKISAVKMTTLKILTFGLILLTSKVFGESYSKSCFLNYLLQHDLLDKTFQIYNNGHKVDRNCETAVNATITKVRSSTNDFCVSNFLKKRLVSETLIKEYLLPQLKSQQTEVHFDYRFVAFMKKAVNISMVVCNNKDVFNPDLRTLARNGRAQQESKTKEIQCLQQKIMVKNKPLDAECKKIANSIEDEFYTSTDNGMKKAFAAPNDNLVNLKCTSEKAKKLQMFDRIFFFVVLATTKNMNDKQIDVLIKSAEGVIGGSTRLIFECMA